jgi:hypothetical protein
VRGHGDGGGGDESGRMRVRVLDAARAGRQLCGS